MRDDSSMTKRTQPYGGKVAVVASFSGTGGVERMVSNLVSGFVDLGVQTDLLIIRKDNLQYLSGTSAKFRTIPLKASHNLSALPEIISYLRRERPRAVLAAKDRAILTVALARRLAGVKTRVVGRLGTTVSEALKDKPMISRWLRYLAMRIGHSMIDATVCVSKGVARDLAEITRIPVERFPVVPNPVITPSLYELAMEPADHPWFEDAAIPVIMGMGRLTRQKAFETLMRAFALVREEVRARLFILGEGRERARLERLASSLGIEDDVAMPGFTPNPYPYLKRASLFVLSSRWEGSPNGLTEAMALGTQVVATDCPSGPREILKGGRLGPLVPVGDVKGLSKAILSLMEHPLDPNELQRGVREYSVEESAKRYLDVVMPHR